MCVARCELGELFLLESGSESSANPEKNMKKKNPWANLIRSALGELFLREPGSGSSTNCVEAVFGVRNASLGTLWELFVEFGEPCV